MTVDAAVRDADKTVITFYSYKGGVGRTMALANVAWALAEEHQLRVVAVDWDIEAPGLHGYFGIEDRDVQPGLMDLLHEYTALLRGEKGAPDASRPLEEVLEIDSFVRPVGAFGARGTLRFMSAGRLDEGYATRVNNFDWNAFYASWHGGAFIERLRATLLQHADIVLIDSRTGITDIGGICTRQLPDVVVLMYALNSQNILGVQRIAHTLDKRPEEGPDRPLPQLMFVPSRVDITSDRAARRHWEEVAAQRLQPYLPGKGLAEATTHLRELRIPYDGSSALGEDMPVRDERAQGEMLDMAYRRLARAVVLASGVGGRQAAEPPGDVGREEATQAESVAVGSGWSLDLDEAERLLAQHAEWVASAGRDGVRADFSRARLTTDATKALAGAELRLARFREASIPGIDLTRASLDEADFAGADITGAHFDGASMRDVSLADADAAEASFRECLLSNVQLDRANIKGSLFHAADLRNATFTDATVAGADFSDCNLEGASFDKAVGVRLARFAGADLTTRQALSQQRTKRCLGACPACSERCRRQPSEDGYLPSPASPASPWCRLLISF